MKTSKGTKASIKIKGQVTQMMGGLEGPAPKLATVRVGERPDDISHERGAVKKMENFGLRVRIHVFLERIGGSDFRAEFSTANRDSDVSGILLLRPLPEQIAETGIEKMVDPEGDLDGISPVNIARVFAGNKTGSVPCIAGAVIEVLKANEIDIAGKDVTIVSRNMVVGRPLSMLIPEGNATITICHIGTRDLEIEYRRAEALVAAAGRAEMPDGHYVEQDAIVIDVDINMDENGKIHGDVNFQSIESVTPMATPVSGGVGVVTTTVPAKYLVLAGRRQRRSQVRPLSTPVFSSY